MKPYTPSPLLQQRMEQAAQHQPKLWTPPASVGNNKQASDEFNRGRT